MNWLTLEAISTEIASGVACGKSRIVADGIPHLRPFSVTADGRLALAEAPIIPIEAVPANRRELRVGDILFNNTNSQDLVGKSALVEVHLDAAFSNHMTRIRVDTRLAEPGFVHRYLNHLFSKRYFEGRATRWVSQAAFGTSQLKVIEIPLPPLDEQRRIVGLLDRAAEIRRRADAARAKARTIIPALFLDMFGDPATNPKGWAVVELGDVIRRITGGKNIEAGNGTSRFRILKVSAVTSGQFKAHESKPAPDGHVPAPEHHVCAGDFLFSRANTSELVGAVAIVNDAPDGLLLPDKIWRIQWDVDRVAPQYAYSLLRTTEVRRIFAVIGSGTSDSMKNISKAKLSRVTVPLPPLPLQTAFAEQANRLDALARALDAAAAKADSMAAALSAEVFG